MKKGVCVDTGSYFVRMEVSIVCNCVLYIGGRGGGWAEGTGISRSLGKRHETEIRDVLWFKKRSAECAVLAELGPNPPKAKRPKRERSVLRGGGANRTANVKLRARHPVRYALLRARAQRGRLFFCRCRSLMCDLSCTLMQLQQLSPRHLQQPAPQSLQ